MSHTIPDAERAQLERDAFGDEAGTGHAVWSVVSLARHHRANLRVTDGVITALDERSLKILRTAYQALAQARRDSDKVRWPAS